MKSVILPGYIPGVQVAPALGVSGRARFALGVFGVFTALIAANALQAAILGAVLGRDFPVGRSIGANALTWYAWAALTPVIAVLVRRFPFAKGRWGRSALVHLAASMVLFGAQFGIFSLLPVVIFVTAYDQRVRELKRESHGEVTVVLSDGRTLRWSRSYRERLETLLGSAG